MRILFISEDLWGTGLCFRLVREGNEVRAAMSDPSGFSANVLDGIVAKVSGLDQGLAWVGKEGLIVVDCVGFGHLQDDLRTQGYTVVGGSAGGDRLEEDRPWCQRVFADCGIPTLITQYFPDAAHAIAHVRHHCASGPWVIKQNGHPECTFCYVGKLLDGSDVIDLLTRYAEAYGDKGGFVLQQCASGVEIGVGRYFNGRHWVGPIEMNVEHKNLFPGGLGPNTGEMGTLMWYDADEQNRLFQETLGKLSAYLAKVDFRGDIAINCIVNEEGAFPLEVTARFGYPALQVQTEIQRSPWGEFLYAVAKGEDYSLQWRQGYGVVALVATPPFPYFSPMGRQDLTPRGLRLRFHQPPSDMDWDHLHPEELALGNSPDGDPEYVIAGDTGYVLHVSAFGEDIHEARKKLYARLGNIVVPRMFYRTDIGQAFLERDRALLEQWGWLPGGQ